VVAFQRPWRTGQLGPPEPEAGGIAPAGVGDHSPQSAPAATLLTQDLIDHVHSQSPSRPLAHLIADLASGPAGGFPRSPPDGPWWSHPSRRADNSRQSIAAQAQSVTAARLIPI
jgi:hypothetical protein